MWKAEIKNKSIFILLLLLLGVVGVWLGIDVYNKTNPNKKITLENTTPKQDYQWFEKELLPNLQTLHEEHNSDKFDILKKDIPWNTEKLHHGTILGKSYKGTKEYNVEIEILNDEIISYVETKETFSDNYLDLTNKTEDYPRIPIDNRISVGVYTNINDVHDNSLAFFEKELIPQMDNHLLDLGIETSYIDIYKFDLEIKEGLHSGFVKGLMGNDESSGKFTIQVKDSSIELFLSPFIFANAN